MSAIQSGINTTKALFGSSKNYLSQLSKLAQVETQIVLTRLSLLAVAVLIAGCIALASWAMLMIAFVLWLNALGFKLYESLLLVNIINLMLLMGCLFYTRWQINKLGWPRTQRQIIALKKQANQQESNHAA